MRETTVSVEDPRPGLASQRFALAILGLSVIILVAMRLHAFDVPLETDECNYAYIGARLLEGDRLYVDVWDHQPPGVFVLFAGAIALFGDAPEVFRWMATGFSVVTLVLVFATTRCLFGTGLPNSGPGLPVDGDRQSRLGDRAAGVAAILFALVSSDPGTAGEGVNREVYMNAFVVAAWYVLVRRSARLVSGNPGVSQFSPWAVVVSGTLLGIGSLLKTVLAIHWVALAVWLAIVTWQTNDRGRRGAPILRQTLVFGAGPLLIWLATLGYFSLDGRAVDFVDAVFGFNLSYGGGTDALTRLSQFWSPPKHPFIFHSAMPLWIVSLLAAPWALNAAIRNGDLRMAAILAMIFASFVAICLPGRFWPHYYYLLIPGCVILVSAMVVWITRHAEATLGGRPRTVAVLSIAICALTPLLVSVTEYRHYLSQPPFGITIARYRSRDFWAKAHGENVRRVTDPEDEIFVFGKDAGIYYYSRRRCASRYTMITGLQDIYSGADQRRRVMLRELEERLPRLILVMADEPEFPEWVAFLHEYYTQPVGWDFSDRTRKAIMFVVARKDNPIPSLDWDWDRSEVGGWLMGQRPQGALRGN